MNWDEIKGNWNHVSDRIKVIWGELTEDDLTKFAGNREQLARLLAEQYGYNNVEAENKVDEFARRLDP